MFGPHVSEKAPSSEAARLAGGQAARITLRMSGIQRLQHDLVPPRGGGACFALAHTCRPDPYVHVYCTSTVEIQTAKKTEPHLSVTRYAERMVDFCSGCGLSSEYNEKKSSRASTDAWGQRPSPHVSYSGSARRMAAWGAGTAPQEGQHALRGGGIGRDGV